MNEEYKKIPLDQIGLDGRVTASRMTFDSDENHELAESILESRLMQPVVVESTPNGPKPWRLVAGGRRYTAFQMLHQGIVENDRQADFAEIPAMLFDSMPRHEQIRLELEENLRRSDPDWKVTVQGIAAYHEAARRANVAKGDSWSQSATGQALGFTQAHVSVCMTLAEALRKGNEEVIACATARDALKVLVAQKSKEAEQELLRRVQVRREAAVKTAVDAGDMPLPQIVRTSTTVVEGITEPEPSQPGQAGEPAVDDSLASHDQILQMYHHGDALDLLPKLASTMSINHIICDPPYGIDMNAFISNTTDGVADTHVVSDNLKLLPEFIRIAFDCIVEDGFLVMWYDLDHHEKIAQWAKQVGWKVQKWPLIWCKTSPCQNAQAQYNFTKSTEVCYFFRKSEKSILRKKQPNNYILAGSCGTQSHPFVKPDEVWGRCIDAVSAENQIIVDPFAGNGSMLAAALKRGRIPYGIEIDQAHIAGGLSYIQKQLSRKSILDEIFAEPSF